MESPSRLIAIVCWQLFVGKGKGVLERGRLNIHTGYRSENASMVVGVEAEKVQGLLVQNKEGIIVRPSVRPSSRVQRDVLECVVIWLISSQLSKTVEIVTSSAS